MFRFLLGLIAIIFLISFIRSIVGLIGKVVAQLFEPQSQSTVRGATAGAGKRTELKPCAICGIYVSTETSRRRTVNGATHYFCSESCLKKFEG